MPTRRSPQPSAFLTSLESSQTRAFTRLVELLGQPDRTLATYHDCAGLIVALQPADAGYGSAWVRELCQELGRHDRPISPSLAYRLIRFAEMFPGAKGTAQVRRLSKRVSWETVMRVLAVEDADKREAILRRAADEELSSRKVIALIREKAGYRCARGGRKAPRPSSHPNRALRDLRALASKWLAVWAAWSEGDNPALKRAARLKPGQITDPFLADLEATAALVEEMGKSARELAGGVADLLRTLRKKRDEVGQDE
jgi:hypothetical protein